MNKYLEKIAELDKESGFAGKAWQGVRDVAHGLASTTGDVASALTGNNVRRAIKQNTKIPVERFAGSTSKSAHPNTPWTMQNKPPPHLTDREVEYKTRPEDAIDKLHNASDKAKLKWVKDNHGQAAHDAVHKAITQRKLARVAGGGAVAYGAGKYVQHKAEEGRRDRAYQQLYGAQQ